MNYIFFALIAAVCFAISQIIGKLLSKHSIDNSDSLMAYFMMASFVFGLLLLPFVSLSWPPPQAWGLIILATSAFLLGMYSFYRGIFQVDVSTAAPLFQLQSALIAILAFMFLGERFPVSNYLWIGLIIGGVVLVTFNEGMSLRSFFQKGVLFILAMQLFHAMSNIWVGMTLEYISPIEIFFWEELLIGVLVGAFILLRKPKLTYSFKQVYPMFVLIVFTGVGAIAMFRAFAENLTISSVIGLASAPIVFVFSLLASRFFPSFLEHHSAKVYLVRGLGLVVMLFGVYQIMVGA